MGTRTITARTIRHLASAARFVHPPPTAGEDGGDQRVGGPAGRWVSGR